MVGGGVMAGLPGAFSRKHLSNQNINTIFTII
jgi:hypothetical protein